MQRPVVMLSPVMLGVNMLSAIILNAIKLNVVMLSFVLLSVAMLSVIMLNVIILRFADSVEAVGSKLEIVLQQLTCQGTSLSTDQSHKTFLGAIL
jgi:hypothetical protein